MSASGPSNPLYLFLLCGHIDLVSSFWLSPLLISLISSMGPATKPRLKLHSQLYHFTQHLPAIPTVFTASILCSPGPVNQKRIKDYGEGQSVSLLRAVLQSLHRDFFGGILSCPLWDCPGVTQDMAFLKMPQPPT